MEDVKQITFIFLCKQYYNEYMEATMSDETVVTPKVTRGKNDTFINGDVFKHNDLKFQCQIVDHNDSLKDLTKYRVRLLHNGIMTQLTRCCILSTMTFVENRA